MISMHLQNAQVTFETRALPETSPWLKPSIAGILVASMMASSLSLAYAELPSGYSVQSGTASFTQSGKALTINASNKAIINYQKFNIGSQNQVNINSALSLHRVTGGSPSQILGQLNSTGKVFLVNPSGIFFGSGSSVNVQGLVASTLNIRDADFLAGNYVFQREAGVNPGQINNVGMIQAAQSLGLFAGAIENSGQLQAPKVALAVGDKLQVQANDLVAMDVTVTESLKKAVNGVNTAILNSGEISGQSIDVQAKLERAFYDTTINNTGVIRAQGLSQNDQGEIIALGFTEDQLGVVENHGVMDVSNDDGQGGTIHVLGDRIHIADGELNASGATGGGEILVGGDYQGQNADVYNAQMTAIGEHASLKADATQSGTGGKIIAWADDSTWSHGQISAKGVDGGGFVETSGKHYLEVTEIPDISTRFGQAGTWLLDPNDLTIGANSTQTNINGTSPFVTTNNTSVVGVNLITAALANGNVSISTGTGGTNSQNGDITISNAINYTGVGGRTLTLNAHRNINQNAAISSTNALNVTMNADTDANSTGNYTSNGSGTITTNGGVVTINANAIALGGTINTGNANVNLNATSTVNSTAPILTGTGVVNVNAPTSTTFNYNVNNRPLNFGALNTAVADITVNGSNSGLTFNNGFNGTSLSARVLGSNTSNLTVNGNVTTTGALSLRAEGGNTSNVVVNGNLTSGGAMDLRSWTNNVTVTGNVTDNSTTGSSILAAGWNSFTSTRNLAISGTLSIAGGATKSLTVMDGDGGIFSKSTFTDGGNRALNSLTYHRADTNGALNLSTLNGFGIPTNNLTLVTLGDNGHITVPTSFNGQNLILQAQRDSNAVAGNITVNGNVATSGTLDLRSWRGDVTVNGNLANTATSGTHYLQGSSNGYSSGRGINVTGSLNIAGGAGKTLGIFDGNGDIFAKSMFTDGTARTFSTIDFRRSDANGGFNFATMNGITPGSVNTTLVTTGANGHIHLNNGFNGASLITQAQGAGSNVSVNGNVATTGTLDLRSWHSDVSVTGNVSNTNAAGTHYLQGGASTLAIGNDLAIGGTLNITGGSGKNVQIHDGDGDIFSKAFWLNPLNFGTLTLRTSSNANIGSLANPITLTTATNSLELQTGGNAYINDTAGVLNVRTQGTVGGTLRIRTAGNLTTSNTATAGWIDWATTANNGAININHTVTGTNGVTLATHGSGGVSIADSRTLAATNAPVSITSRTLTMNNTGAITAGANGTVTLKPNDASAITLGAASKGAGFNVSAGELSRITAQTLAVGDLAQAGDILLGGALNVSGAGAGRYNLDFKTGGAFNASGNALTLGARDLTVTTGGNLTTAAITGGAGSDVTLTSSTGQIAVNNALAAQTANLVAAGDVVLNNGSSITTSGAGNSLVVASTGGQFNNQAGGSALSAASGRWLVYSGDPSLTNRNALTGFKRYNRTYSGNPPAGVSESGNGFLYRIAPVLTLSADDTSKTYGSVNPTLTGSLNPAGLIDGDTLGTAVTGQGSFSTLAHQASNVGNYTINAAQGTLASELGYQFATASGTLSVTPKALSVTANDAAKTYGDLNPALSASYDGFVLGQDATALGGSLNLSTAATQASNVGNYDITAGGLTSSNYDITFNNGTLAITPKALSVTANDASKTYGDVNPTLSASYNGFVLGQDASALGGSLNLATAATQASNVGNYGIAASGLSSSNYDITFNNGNLAITPKALNVRTNNTTKTYGDVNPAFNASYNGFALGQDASALGGTLSFNTAATQSSNVGVYDVTPSGLTSSNYTINFQNGGLGVLPKALQVQANNTSKTYGDANPALSASYNGFVLGQNASALGGSLNLATAATQSSNVGTYAITPSGLTSTNYTVSFHNGNLAVTPKALSVTANDAERRAGQVNPAFTASFDGFVLGQNESALGGNLMFNTPARFFSPAGQYAITPGGVTSSNYAISFNNGTLTVQPRLPEVANQQAQQQVNRTFLLNPTQSQPVIAPSASFNPAPAVQSPANITGTSFTPVSAVSMPSVLNSTPAPASTSLTTTASPSMGGENASVPGKDFALNMPSGENLTGSGLKGLTSLKSKGHKIKEQDYEKDLAFPAVAEDELTESLGKSAKASKLK